MGPREFNIVGERGFECKLTGSVLMANVKYQLHQICTSSKAVTSFQTIFLRKYLGIFVKRFIHHDTHENIIYTTKPLETS